MTLGILYGTNTCQLQLLTAPFSAVVKYLPPASDPVPDADIDQNPGQASTVHQGPALILTLDPFPDSNSNQSQTTRSILKTALKKKTNTLLRYLEDVRNQRRLTLINQSVANIFWENLQNKRGEHGNSVIFLCVFGCYLNVWSASD